MSGYKYPPELIEEARKMYVTSQLSCATIAEELSRKTGKYIPGNTVTRWRAQNKWDEDRRALVVQQVSGQGKALDVELDDRTREHLRMYELMVQKGGQALEQVDLTMVKPTEAADIIDRGIKGEREIRSGAIALKLINSVIDILRSEVEDPEVLARVSLKLRNLLVSR